MAVTRRSTVRAPTGMAWPCSANSPRIAFIRATRAVCHCVRTRCIAWSVCCSTVFTGTGRMSPQRAAKERVGVRAVCLVSSDVGPHVLHGQELHSQTARLHPASPVVRGTARLHDHLGVFAKGVKESLESTSREPL